MASVLLRIDLVGDGPHESDSRTNQVDAPATETTSNSQQTIENIIKKPDFRKLEQRAIQVPVK